MKELAIMLLALCLSLAVIFTGCNGVGSSSQESGPIEVSIFSRPLPERNGLTAEGKKVDWLDVSSFCCYYGAYDEKMNNYDVAICESRSLGAEGIQKLNEAGVWTICYITIGEDDGIVSCCCVRDIAVVHHEMIAEHVIVVGSCVMVKGGFTG